MECKKVRELILTDYGDREMDKAAERSLMQHLGQCPSCEAFLQTVRKTAHDPFVQAHRQPPSYLWGRIQDALVEKKMSEAVQRTGVWQRCKDAFSFRQPLLGWGTAFALVIMVAAAVRLNVPVKQAIPLDRQAQYEYFSYVMTDTPEAMERQAAGFGTAIEEYFL